MDPQFLSSLTDEQLLALQAGDYSKLTNEQLQTLYQTAQQAAPKPEVEPQKLRTFIQGATMGAGEEAEAKVREILGGAPYS